MQNEPNSIVMSLRGINKSFSTKKVLIDLDLEIKRNTIITIMGESGAGKSTLLNILGFLDTPDSGTISFMGKEVRKRYEFAKIRNRYLGFVFQAYNLIPSLTVRENITLPIEYSIICEKQKKELRDNIDSLLTRFGLNDIAGKDVELISGGEKQRACLVRALASGAEIIISDEPTGNLDKANRDIVLDAFRDLNKEGKTIVIVTHDEAVTSVATDKYVLKEGRLHRYV